LYTFNIFTEGLLFADLPRHSEGGSKMLWLKGSLKLILILCDLTKLKTIIDAGEDVGLEINVNKTKYIILLSRYVSADQKRGITVANRSFENVPQFKCFGTTERIKI
jgi:hypothetical protein